MTYSEIFILGWNLNALMFIANFMLAIKVMSNVDKERLMQESEILKDLKEKLEKYYPYRTITTFIAYAIPFTAFFRVIFKMFEMYFFIQKNQEAKMFDYIAYKYNEDISRAQNK